MGAVALLGLIAYLFTPLSAAGAEGAPVGFGINIRYAIPPLLLGLMLLPLSPRFGGTEGELSSSGRAGAGRWILLAAPASPSS